MKHVIAHMVELAHDLGIAVVCEGVETREQMEFLRAAAATGPRGIIFRALCPAKRCRRPKSRRRRCDSGGKQTSEKRLLFTRLFILPRSGEPLFMGWPLFAGGLNQQVI